MAEQGELKYSGQAVHAAMRPLHSFGWPLASPVKSRSSKCETLRLRIAPGIWVPVVFPLE